MLNVPKKIGLSHILFALTYFFTVSVGVVLLGSGWMFNKLPKVTQSLAESGNNSEIRSILNTREEIVVRIDENPNYDPIADKIDSFFKKHNSPLAGYGREFTENARKNQIDETIVAAISWCESNGGKVTPQFGNKETYNAWGYAVFDSNSVTKSVNGYDMGSWENGIAVVSRAIKKYYDKGLIEPYEIVTQYTPASVRKAGGNPHEAPWTKCVNNTINQILYQE